MKVVYKYPLDWVDYVTLALPEGAKILTVGVQQGAPVLWALVDPESPITRNRTIRIAGTGHPIDEDNLKYIGLLKLEALYFHVFEAL